MDSEEKKVFQEKIFSRLNARVGEAARGVRVSSQALFQQIEELSAELGRCAREGAAEAAGAMVEEVARARDAAAGAAERTSGLARSVCAILEQNDQVSVLEAMLEGALRFTDGAVLFVLKGESLGGWRCGGTIDGSRAKTVHFPLTSRNSLARALRDRESLCVVGDFSGSDSEFLGELGSGRPVGFVVVPLVVRDRAQALLFGAGYREGDPPGQVELAAFQALAAAATSAIENIQGRTRKGVGEERSTSPAAKPRTPKPAPLAAVPPAEPPVREPERSLPATTDQADQAHRSTPEPSVSTAADARPATESAETGSGDPAPGPGDDEAGLRSPWFTPSTRSSSLGSWNPTDERRSGFGLLRSEPDGGGEEPLSPEEQELHDDAMRFARLLVSEIKLYNEAKVADGRQEKDLYQRLRSDIERSRQMYHERVPPSVAAKTNYFMEELVAILAEGDRATLGM